LDDGLLDGLLDGDAEGVELVGNKEGVAVCMLVGAKVRPS